MLRSSILSAFSLVNPTRINHLLFFKKIKKKIKKEKEKKKETNKSVCGHIIFFSLFHSLPQFFFPPLSPTTTVQLRPPPFSSGHHEQTKVCACISFSFSLFHSLPQFFFPPLSPTTTKQCRHPPDAHHLVNLPVWSFRSVFFFPAIFPL